MFRKDPAKAIPLGWINPFIRPLTHLFIHPSIIPPPILPSAHLLDYPSVHLLSIHPSIYLFIYKSTNPDTHPSVYPSTSPLIFPPTHYFMRSARNYRDRAVTNRYDFCSHGSEGLVGDMCANQSVHRISTNSDVTYLRIGISTLIVITSEETANMCELPG